MTQADIKALIEENAKLKAKLEEQARGNLKVSISAKSGGIMVTGLRKFPVTFYQEEWKKLFSLREQIETLIKNTPEQPKLAG